MPVASSRSQRSHPRWLETCVRMPADPEPARFSQRLHLTRTNLLYSPKEGTFLKEASYGLPLW